MNVLDNHVEKIAQRKGDKVLVRWKGRPEKYDTCIEKRDLLKTGYEGVCRATVPVCNCN